MILVDYAERELRLAGLFDKDSDYGGGLGPATLAIVKVFAGQGYSGFSASIVTSLLEKLLRYQPLSPLTGADDEWTEVGNSMFQNKRCSSVFRENGETYDINGFVFREPSGACYTNRNSRRLVTFPYTPATEYVDVPGEPGDKLPAEQTSWPDFTPAMITVAVAALYETDFRDANEAELGKIIADAFKKMMREHRTSDCATPPVTNQ